MFCRHSRTLQQLEEANSALEGFTSLLEQAQGQIETLITEQQALRNDNSRLNQELDGARARLAAERIQRASEPDSQQSGLHSETYRSLLEQKQHQKIE